MSSQNNLVQEFDLSEELDSDQLSLSERGSGNKNLSDVLAQIKDDGPAMSHAKGSSSTQADNLLKFQTSASTEQQSTERDTATSRQRAVSAQNSYEEIQRAAAESYSHISTEKDNQPAESKLTIRLQWLLLLIIAGAAGYSIFHVNQKTTQLEREILSLNGSKTVVEQTPALPPGAATETAAEDTDIVTENALLARKAQASESKVLDLNAEITQLKSQLQIANDRIDELDVSPVKVNQIKFPLRDMNDNIVKPLPVKKASSSIKHSKAAQRTSARPVNVTAPRISGWKVNLASFSDKSKAEAIYNRLLKSGVSPSLETATINGSKRYRLTVGGFKKRSDAATFVKQANRKYGLTGAWIRQVQV